jgi:hypothetical protein
MSEKPRPSLEEFTKEMEQAVRAAGYTGPIVRQESQKRLQIDGDRALSVEHCYEQLAGLEPRERASMLAKAARMLVDRPELPTTWEETRPLLRVNAKPQIQLVADELRRQAGAGPAPVYSANLTPHLALELAVPYPDGSLSVPRVTLEGWGVTAEQAFEAAGQNEAETLHRPWLMDPKWPGVYRSPWQDSRDGGRLMLRRAFSALPLQGRPVVMLPAPSKMLVAGSDDPVGLSNLADLVLEDFRRTKRHHFLRALCASEDGLAWEDWLPPIEHPTCSRFRTLQALQEVREASEHAERVDEVARAKGHEVLPFARLELVMEARLHLPVTVTTWRAGKPVALPKADGIVLRRGNTDLGLVAWEDFVATLPGTLTKLGGYPARYLASDFPEDWQLGMLELRPWKPPRAGPFPGAPS